jgi:hypothetical protein
MWRDLYADQLVPLSSDEALDARSAADAPDAAPDSVAVVIRSGEPHLQVPAESSDVRVNGDAPQHDQRLQTGDDIEVGEAHFTVVVRR